MGFPAEKFRPQRSHIRYTPEPMEVAYIRFSDLNNPDWQPNQVALIEEESARGGCGLIFHRYEHNDYLCKGEDVSIKLGQMEPLLAKCVYIVPISDHLMKAGFKFLE